MTAHGITLELIDVTRRARVQQWARRLQHEPTRERNRRLRGKTRRLARKAARRPLRADVIGLDMDGIAS